MKNSKNKDLYGKGSYNPEVKKTVIITVVVLLSLALIYFLTALATGEIKLNNKTEKEETEVSIQYEEIVAGQVLNRNQDEYYVMLYKFTDNNATYLMSLKDSYGAKDNALSFYIVDLDKSFNEVLKTDEEKIAEKPSNITDLKVNDTTILKVKNKKVTERITGTDSVEEFLQSLNK